MSARRRLLGITLIEAAALAIVALVLLAILWPMTACACGGDPSHKTACISNLKQDGLGALMYAGDYDDHFPIASAWMDELKPYVHQEEALFHDTYGVSKSEYGFAFRKLASSMDQKAPKDPSKFVILFESSLTGRNARSELWSLPRPGRHLGWDGLVFTDGHARMYAAGDPAKSIAHRLDDALQDDEKSGPVR